MMQDQSRKITYGAMMLALFTILLAGALYIPLLGSIILIFIPLPIILYRLRYDRSSTIFVALAGSILSLVVGGILLVPFAVVFGLLGFLIAESVLLGKSKLYTFMATGLFFILTGVLVYLIVALVFEINAIDSLMAMLKEMEMQFKASLANFGALPESYEKIVEEAFTMYRSAIPAIFILSVYMFAFIMVIPNFEVLRRLGHPVPKFSPFREMKLPVITIFIYGLIILLPYIMDLKPESSAFLLYVNATIILRVLLLLQGLALVQYFMYKMKLPTVATVFATIFALLFSPITTLLGILDIGVNIRAWIGKDNLK
ncbi:YybS family protein [Sporosarcina sp. SAFN-015]|uniref:YybS family protein n=1 Tax=Sporosarcina sp. SAFN-015 TaxID=3387274 RepID=UPI003F82360A